MKINYICMFYNCIDYKGTYIMNSLDNNKLFDIVKMKCYGLERTQNVLNSGIEHYIRGDNQFIQDISRY